MALTPQIVLTATLLDYSGVDIGTSAKPAYLRIALRGFGQTLPCIPGTGNLAKVSSWPGDIPFIGAQITVHLWGNDVIFPASTYYAISLLDANKNVVQSGVYVFNGQQNIDLSSAPQIEPPAPVILPPLQYVPLTGTVPGTVYTGPGRIVMLTYNTIPQRPGIDYNLSGAGTIATLTFTTSVGDEVYGLCLA